MDDVADMSRPTNAGTSERSNVSVQARRVMSVIEAAVVVMAGAVIVGCLIVLGVLVADPGRGEEWTTGLRPVNFYRELDAELLDDYAGTFAVAHNSGDSVEATLVALGRGADIIEVDVVAVDGRLYAAHGMPVNWVGNSFFRGPPLERVWIASAAADVIKLDLKDNSPQFRELLIRFLAARDGQRRVIVVSSDPAVLQLLATERPAAIRLLSVGSAGGFRPLEENPDLLAVVDGVSVRHTLIDRERATWLEERGLLTLAWTVNDLTRVNELVTLGVDAITTDNLAIMTLLGGQERTENPLDRLRRPSEPELTGGGR